MRALEGESRRRTEAELATSRAEENVALSLASFEDLFQKLDARGPALPPPPAYWTAGRRAVPAGRTNRSPSGGGRPGAPEDDAALMQSVLTFFDRFARHNATNTQLQGEAARAYRRVGILYQRLGRMQEAEESFTHAVSILESLVARYPAVPRYRHELARSYGLFDPATASVVPLPRLEQQFRQALVLYRDLAGESYHSADNPTSQARVETKLGVTLQQEGNSDEAESCYRRAVALFEGAARGPSGSDHARIDLAGARALLAALIRDRGRRDEALIVLDAAAADLLAVASQERISPFVRRSLESYLGNLADSFEELGLDERARALETRAATLRARGSGGSPRRPVAGNEPGTSP
jgi:tetratricopeptide (TPR) repeat protein